MIDTLLVTIYILHASRRRCFILALKWMNSPATARRGVFAGEIGMLLAVVGTLLRIRGGQLPVDLRGIPHRLGDRRADRLHHADDGGSAADGDLAGVRRAGRGADRHGGILPGSTTGPK